MEDKRRVCNLCGKEFDLWDDSLDIHIRRDIGYGSEHDGERLDMRVCCECLDKLISACKVSPVKEPGEYCPLM